MDIAKYKQKVGFVHFYLILFAFSATLFMAGIYAAEWNQKSNVAEKLSLQKSLSLLTQEHEKVVTQFNQLQLELDVLLLAQEDTKNQLRELVQREQNLKEQIAFYQRVLAPELSQDGFIVERMEVVPTLSDDNFLIKMILLQYEDVKSVIKGELEVSIVGSLDGKIASFPLTELLDNTQQTLNFAFKYFQVLEVSITIPEGFRPEKIEIKTDVYKYKRKRGSYSTIIDWEESLSTQ